MSIEAGPIFTDPPATRWATVCLALLQALTLCAAASARPAGYATFGLGLVLPVIWYTAWRRSPSVEWQPVAWLAAVAALAALSVAWALDRHAASVRAAEMAPLLLIGGAAVVLMPALAARVPRRWLWLLPMAYALALLLTGLDLQDGFLLQRLVHGGDRMIGTKHLIRAQLLNRNILCLILLFAPMAGLVFSLPGWTMRWRWLAVAALAVLATGMLVVTASQTAQLAFALVAVVAFAFPYRWRAARYALITVIVLMVLGAPWLAQWMFARVTPLVAHSSSQEVAHAYMPERMEIWDFVSRYALQRPLTGFGIDATRAVPAFDSRQLFLKSLTTPHPHNFALQLWMEFGVFGAALGAAFLAATLLAIFRRPVAAQRILLPTFIASLAGAAMTFSLWQGWWLGVLFLAASFASFSASLISKPVTEIES